MKNIGASNTLTLPDPATNTGRILILTLINSAGNTLSLSRNITVDGGTTSSMLNNNNFMIQSDGTNWYAIFARL